MQSDNVPMLLSTERERKGSREREGDKEIKANTEGEGRGQVCPLGNWSGR